MPEMHDSVAAHTRMLGTWAAGVRDGDLPPQVARKAALVIADDLAAIIGARGEPEVAKFHRGVSVRAGREEATIFRGGRTRTDRLSAAVANAVAADWLELDEGYRKVSCHAGLYVVPALLAEAEAENLSVREMLRATAIAYEVVTRVARAFTPADDAIHSHANYSAIGASAATAAARKLGAGEFCDALSAAFTFCFAGPRNHVVKGALVRNTWPAVGAWSGMMSVEWARCGIAGLPESGYDALVGALHATAQPDRLTAGLGREWAVLDGYTKIFACCQHAHSAAEAALALRSQLSSDGGLAQIEQVVVETHRHALKLTNSEPATTLAAKFSMPHVVAATLAFGEAGARAFFSDTLSHAEIAALRGKVRVTPYLPERPPPNDRPARVHVHLRGGRVLSSECLSAAGGPDRPFGEEVVIDKITELTAAVYPRLAGVMQRIIGLDAAQLAGGWRETVAEFCGSDGATRA